MMKPRVGGCLLMTVLGLGLLGGCAQPGGGTLTPGSPGSPSSGAAGTPSDSVDASGCHRHLRVTDADTSATFCVSLGGTVSVSLTGAPGRLWRPVQATGEALAPAAGGPSSAGVTLNATFEAVHPGTSTLNSARPLCPPAPPGGVSCMGMQAFQVTIQVR